MADYHPLIARAVSGLEKNSGENRRALYERARIALVAQLRGVVPALEESEITRERLSLEEAIRKVEAEAARQAREAVRPPIPRRTELPRREEPPRRDEAPGREEPPRSAPRSPLTPSTLASPRPVRSPEPPPENPAPPPPRPAVSTRRTLQDEALKFRDSPTYPDIDAEPRRPQPREPQPRESQPREPQPRETWESVEANLPRAPALPSSAPSPPERHPLEDYGQLEPQLQAENLWALPLDGSQGEPPVDLDAQHPPVQRHQARDEPDEQSMPRRPPRSYGKMIRIGLVLTLIVAVGSIMAWQYSNIVAVAGNLTSGVMALFGPSSAPPREVAAPARPKITDRIGQPSAQPSGPPVAQRVVLYEEEPDDPAGKRFVGTVLWRTETRPATPGRPPELAVRGDVEVPERKMSVTLSFRRNTDASLPASHTIEIVFTLPPETPGGGVQKVPGVLMKQAEQTRGVPLAGLAVPVTPGYFLIGLSSLESDMQRNVQLLKERSWFDIPIIYNNNRRAILAVEKGTPGEQAFTQAFAAWKQ
jgi:hypothetical protein